MTLFQPGVEVFAVTAPFGPNVPTWPTHPPAIVEPGPYGRDCLPLKLAVGDGAPARVLFVRRR